MIKSSLNLTLFVLLFWNSIAMASMPEFPVKKFKSFFASVGLKSFDDEINWSGGHWNPVTKTLYFCRNKWGIRSYKFTEVGGKKVFKPLRDIEFKPKKKHDFESITQVDLDSEKVWVINENEKRLEEYDLSTNTPEKLSEWKLKKVSKKDESFEGLVFIPNDFLKKYNFRDGEGKLYPKSKNGNKGIFLISDQKTGHVFAIDLDKNEHVNVIGSYRLPTESTRALDLDYESGLLFGLDGEKFVMFSLESRPDSDNETDREFLVKKVFKGPGPEAAEGLAVIPNIDQNTISFMITDDDNLKGIAIRWYEVDKKLIFK